MEKDLRNNATTFVRWPLGGAKVQQFCLQLCVRRSICLPVCLSDSLIPYLLSGHRGHLWCLFFLSSAGRKEAPLLKPVKQKDEEEEKTRYWSTQRHKHQWNRKKRNKNHVKPGGRTFWTGSGTFRDMRDCRVNDKVKIQMQLNGGGMVVNEQIEAKSPLSQEVAGWLKAWFFVQTRLHPWAHLRHCYAASSSSIYVFHFPSPTQAAINQDWLKDTHTQLLREPDWVKGIMMCVDWIEGRYSFTLHQMVSHRQSSSLDHISFTFITNQRPLL